jgi:hypothetical protein
MDNPGTMNGSQGGRHPDRDAVQDTGRQWTLLLYDLGEAGAVHIFDDQVGCRVFGIGVDHLRGAERRHLARPVDLAAEAAAKLRIIGEFGADDLDRDQAPPRTASQIDGAHATLAETAEQLIMAELIRVTRAQRRQRHGAHITNGPQYRDALWSINH